ncbi:MAG: glycosyltransferase family 4 protein [Pirellulales bacterium]|nr:glycosyltransferase family 4 protein [Pirellulales bacterium]
MSVSHASTHSRRAASAASIAAKLIRPRRVLQVITPSHMSGAETQVCRLTKQMRARGHEMRVIVKHDSSALAEMQSRLVDVEPARIGGKVNVFAIPAIIRAAKRHGAELVQSNLSTASWWCGWAETLGGPKSVGHVHGFTSARWHRRQSHLLAVSGAVRDDLIAHGISGDRVTVLHNALSPEEFRPTRDPLDVRAEFGADAKTPVVGTFAHLSEKKGYRELFGAMPRILKAAPTTQFWIMGTGGLRDELEATARAGGFLKQVRFAGFRRDSADVMNAIDVLALPSRREPCALVYVEAALLAKPIVACRAGGAPESVADGETGILVPVNDSPAIAEAVLGLLENRDFAHRMGEAGRDRALEIFSWAKFIATLEGVYDKVLS